jgi:hypothetical protein
VDLDAHFHRGLIGAKLDHLERDILRKCDALDIAVRIFFTKLPPIVASLIVVFKVALGTPLALLLGPAFVITNMLSRQLIR